jgi:uncharacterized protein YdeI (BOF family)
MEETPSSSSATSSRPPVSDVTLTLVASRDKCLDGVVNTHHVLAQLQTPPLQQEARPPLELVALVDRSGSMQGKPIQFARRAVCKLIKHLTPADTFHFVVYDDKADVVIENGDLNNKPALVEAVKKIRDRGGTNIGIGLQKAFTLLTGLEMVSNEANDWIVRPGNKAGEAQASTLQQEESHANRPKDASPRTKRVFLFSDGQANAGVKSRPGLCGIVKTMYAHGVTVSSFGIGSSYDEVLMKGIAEAGWGGYYYLAAAPDIPRKVSKAIHGLLALVGTEAKLFVQGQNGATVKKVYAQSKSGGNPLLEGLPIGDLFGDNLKQVLFKISIDPSKFLSSGGDIEVLKAELSWLPVTGEDNTSEGKTETARRVITQTLSLGMVSSASQLPPENIPVMVALQIQKTAKKNRQIVKVLEKHQREEAIRLKEELIQQLERWEAKDETGRIKIILQKARVTCEELKSKNKILHSMTKKVDYEAYEEAEDDAQGYLSGEDSDEEAYSDEEEQPIEADEKGSEEEEDDYLSD